MDRDSVDWRGYIPAITTPFDAGGDLDWDGLDVLLDWLVAERMHGIIVAGTTGEWFSLAPEERCALFERAARRIAGRMPVLGGCNAYTPAEAIRYARAAADAGLDGILLTPPPYVVPTPREVVAFYTAVSEAVPIPLCVYNWPRGTRVDLDAEIVLRLAELDTVVAIKNSTGDVANVLDVLFAVRDRLRVFGVPANELGATLVRHHGADGTMGAGAVLGSDHPEFFERVWAGDLDEALRVGARDRLLFDHWIKPDYAARFGSPQAIMKAALDLRGVPGGHVRPPLLPLTEEETERVRATLAELGLLAAAV